MTDILRAQLLDDLLEAEREFRHLAEQHHRALVDILTELAYRWAGDRLEQARQADPSIPRSWTPEEWRAFFRSLDLAPRDNWRGDKDNPAWQERIAALEREVALWRQRAQRALHSPAQPPAPPEKPGAPAPPPLPSPLEGFQMPRIPAAYEHRFAVAPGMSKADAALHLRRRAMILYCMAQGKSVFVEIGRLVGAATAAQPRSGALRRAYDALVTSGLVISKTLAMQVNGNTSTRLVVGRLSAEGKQLCAIWGWEVQESDWERLLRLHEGERQEEHTLACLLFAVHARALGWNARLLPEVAGPAQPDLELERDQTKRYVEVELEAKTKTENTKWRLNAELNNGHVAFVARNTAERAQLREDCRHIAPHGYAADIEFLTHVPSSLWAEEW